jgi:hypothetical protein
MKRLISLAATIVIVCAVTTHCFSQNEVSIVKSVPLTIQKVNTPVRVVSDLSDVIVEYKTLIATNTADPTKTNAQNDATVRNAIDAKLNDPSVKGYELISCTPYRNTNNVDPNSINFLMIFKKTRAITLR